MFKCSGSGVDIEEATAPAPAPTQHYKYVQFLKKLKPVLNLFYLLSLSNLYFDFATIRAMQFIINFHHNQSAYNQLDLMQRPCTLNVHFPQIYTKSTAANK
jgi:hypothetical protein